MTEYLVKDFERLSATSLTHELNKLAKEDWALRFVVADHLYIFEGTENIAVNHVYSSTLDADSIAKWREDLKHLYGPQGGNVNLELRRTSGREVAKTVSDVIDRYKITKRTAVFTEAATQAWIEDDKGDIHP